MPARHFQEGFSYASVLLSAALVAALLVPGLEALQSALAGNVNDRNSARQFALIAKMERVLSASFSKLYAETYRAGGNTTSSVSPAYSDPVGQSDRRLVVLYRYDASAVALSNDDTGLLSVNVYYEGDDAAYALRTLRGRWW